MARYIDADKMREEWLENGENEYVYDTNSVLDSIDAQPTADVVEVKHGRWIRHKENCLYNRCSICCYEHCRENNYCPNCGAKMDGTPKERSEG